MGKTSSKSSSTSGSWKIGWVSVSYTKSWWKTTYNIWWKSYSDVKSAANAIKSSPWFSKNWEYTNSKWQSFWNNRSSWSSFIDPGVLQDQHMGMSASEIASKWWWPTEAWQSKVTQALAKHNRTYWSWGYTSYDSNTWLYSKPEWSSSTTADPASQYSEASYKNYSNAFNKYKSQWMSDADARAQATKLLENEDLLSNNNQDKIAEETQDNNVDANEDTLYGLLDDEDYNYDEDVYDQDMNDQLVPEWMDDYINERISPLEEENKKLKEQLEDNAATKKAQEEKDSIYDYNTYVTPNTTYTWWESKDIQSNWLTFAEKYVEPVTNALQDLGLLTPNEQAATAEWVEEQPAEPKTYNTWDELVNDFNTELEWINLEWWVDTKGIAQKYVDFKQRLERMRDNNQISPEEYEAYLNQLRNNETIQTVLRSINK